MSDIKSPKPSSLINRQKKTFLPKKLKNIFVCVKFTIMTNKKHTIIAASIATVLCVISLFAMLPMRTSKNTSKGESWMKDIDGDTTITSLSIPGSHDAGAFYSFADLSGKCQDLSIKEQLYAGARFFDIRLQQQHGTLKVVHGFVDQKLNFSSVLEDFQKFLNSHTSEALIVSIKMEKEPSNTEETFDISLRNALEPYGSLWNTTGILPSALKEARGKIFLISRYENSSIGLPAHTGWLDPEKETSPNTFDIESSNIHVQDHYKIGDIDIKKNEIVSCFDYSGENPGKLAMNFTSCYYVNDYPPTYAGTTAKIINPWLKEEIKNRNKLGIVISDFITSDLCEAIYSRNK